MKKIILFSAFCILSYAVIAQKNPVMFGSIDSINSKLLNEQRKVWIYVPNGYTLGSKTNEKYPVVYLLDGDAHFQSVVSVIEHLSSSDMCPPMIVVGILHKNRMLDLTPTIDLKDDPTDTLGKKTGGGEKFMAFMEKELLPHIEKSYPTAPYRIFIGHSLGGLTVMNALINHNIFNSYVSIDPSMWWDNEKLLKQSKNTLNTKNYSGKSLFLTLANRMEKGVDTVLVQKDTAESTALIRANLKLIRYITATRQNQLRFKHKYYDDETHGSVPLISEYDAFRFIFDYYRFPKHNSYFTDTSIQLETVVAAHYNNVSQQMGYVVKPNESLVNNLGYRTLGEKQFDRAEKLFKLNIANYPESANVYDSLGDLYLAKGNKLKAIESFKKALTIAEVPETREKLTELLKQ